MSRANRGRNSSTSWIRKSTRFAVLQRDRWLCSYCTRPLSVEAHTLDHVRPEARGGSHVGNLVAACLTCNSSRRARPLRTFLRDVGMSRLTADAEARRLVRRAAVLTPTHRADGLALARFYRAVRSL